MEGGWGGIRKEKWGREKNNKLGLGGGGTRRKDRRKG